MHLKKIEMSGFKSFADKIAMSFGPGLGVIVGPNGSGKSNIADALRWALGEQSAKELRGGKMEDVIFAGTQHRKPVGFADVTLRLCNKEKKLPMDSEEVSVTRRAYRSGESEFLINGQPCRLKDIQRLFMDTGIGRDGYSIIGQGRVDEILSQKSEERRSVFEEAAGIAKFKARRGEAEQKLEKVKQNHLRVKDVISELAGQLGPLKVQSDEAKKFLQLRDEHRELHISLFLLEAGKVDVQRREAGLALENARAQSDGIGAALKSARLAAEDAKQRGARAEEEYRALNQRIVEMTARAEKEQGEISLLENNIEKWQGEAARLGAESDKREARLAAKSAEMAGHAEKKRELEAGNAAGAERLARLEEEKARREKNLAGETEATEGLTGSMIAATEDAARAKAAIGHADGNAARLAEEKARVQKSLADCGEKLAEQEKRHSMLAEEEEAFKKGFLESTTKARELRAECEKRRAQAAEQEAKMQAAAGRLAAESAKLDAQRSLDAAHEGYYRSVKAVLARKEQLGGICGAVGEIFRTEPAYETALETALGGSLQNIVTETDEDAKRAIEMLKKTKEGRATFLPIASIETGRPKYMPAKLSDENGFVGIAKALVRHDAKYAAVADSLLGDIAVFASLDDALAAAKKHRHSIKIVTLGGERLSPGGAITGGHIAKQGTGVFGRSGLLERLAAGVAALRRELEEARRLHDGLRGESDAAQRRLAEIQEALQGARLDGERHLSLMQASGESLRRLSQDSHELAERLRALEKEGLEAARQRDEAAGLLAESERKRAAAAAEIDRLKKDSETKKSELEEEGGALTELRIEMSRTTERLRSAEADMARVAAEMEILAEEKRALEREKDANWARAAAGRQELAGMVRRLEKTKAELGLATEAHAKCETAKGELAAALAETQDGEKALSEKAGLLEREMARLEMQAENLESAYRRLHDEIWEEYGLTRQAALAQENPSKKGREPAALKKRMAEIKPELARMFDVNIGAIEAYKTLREKHEFLNGQSGDLQEAKDRLAELIRSLTGQMEAQFRESFAEIDKNFRDVFSEIFSGGSAGLRLSDQDNVLESGIEIIAQPPGKSLRNLLLLSGGERALTAIALLFAILRLRPSPFCVLDEIESALDDANVARFASFIKRYTDGTQFIVITHRKGTMEAADSLYGITMEEQGVSKLVTVKLTDVS